VEKRYRSRRMELAALRTDLRAKGATYRHIARLISAQYNVNSRVAHRLAHGMTQQQVADAWNELWPAADGESPITHKQISYWEAWPAPTGRAPSAQVLDRLARIYHCSAGDLLDGEDYAYLDPAAPATSVPQPASSTTAVERAARAEPSDVLTRVDAFIAESRYLGTRESDYQELVNRLIEWACRMKRRDILQWLSWATAAAAAAPVLENLDPDERERAVLAFATPRRVDGSVVDHIEAVLWRCMREDDTLGPQAALDTTLAQRSLVRSILPEAPGNVKDRLLSLYANMSRFAGWLSFDLNNYQAAAEYYESARAAAHEAHNTELGAFVLCNMSHLATWRGQPRIGIDHAVAAQGWANQTGDARLQAYAYDVTARAQAMDSGGRAALAAIDQARTLLAKAAADPTPTSFVYFYNPGQLASTESICYLRLGQPEKGAAVAESALRQINGVFVRNLAMASLRLGMCRLFSKKPDINSATSAIRDAARLASQNRSVRLVQRLQRCWRELEPWQDCDAVREVRDELAVYRVVA